jgi:hypothetical protein
VDGVIPQLLGADHGNCVIWAIVNSFSFVMAAIESKTPSPAVELLAVENFHSQFHAHHPSSLSQGVYHGIYAIGKALHVNFG